MFYVFYAAEMIYKNKSIPKELSSPPTLVALLTMALAFAFGTVSQRYRSISWILLIFPFYISLVALTGYVLSDESFYTYLPEVGISIPTAISINLLTLAALYGPLRNAGNGFLLASESGGAVIRYGLPIALFLPPICTWLIWSGHRAGQFGVETSIVLLVVVPCLVLSIAVSSLACLLTGMERKTVAEKAAKKSIQEEFCRYRDQESARAHFGAVIESSADAIISQDLSGNITFWNDAATNLFGLTSSAARGKSFASMLDPDDLSGFYKALDKTRNGEVVREFEVSGMGKDSKDNVDISLSIAPIRNSAGLIFEISILARNISDLKRELKYRKELTVKLHQANIAKDEFLANLSHELRTPLNAILGFIELLPQMEYGSADYASAMEIIRRSSRAELGLVDSILDLSSIIAGKLKLDSKPFCLRSLLEHIVESNRLSFMIKEVTLSADIDNTVDSYEGDELRIQQIIGNILANALKFTGKGGRVQLVARQVNSNYEIMVIDSGIGIPKEKLAMVFHRFWQEDASFTRRYQGLGIGLSIAQHLAKAHGGEISVASDGEGLGTTFVVRLPHYS